MNSPAAIGRELDRLDTLQASTRHHRARHGCNAYTFEDGAGLLAIARSASAVRVLELGTALGYTACVLATATEDTHVDTIEGDPEHVADLGLDRHVTVHSGDFFEVMAKLDGSYDLTFFDGLGPSTRIIDALHAKLRSGGLLVCGNIAHAGSTERLKIAADFGHSGRWQFAGSIEGGRDHGLPKGRSKHADAVGKTQLRKSA